MTYNNLSEVWKYKFQISEYVTTEKIRKENNNYFYKVLRNYKESDTTFSYQNIYI